MLFIVGPTGAGKSEIAVEVALRCDAEIVGADAFQVYEGLGVLTARPGEELMTRVRHHLIGEIPIGEKFDVGRYREMVLERVREIEGRGKRALVVGGTGLYVRALTHGLSDLPKEDAAIRNTLEGLTLEELQGRYAALDPLGMERIDRQNRRRLTRAIEVTLLAGKPFSSLREDWSGSGMERRDEVMRGVVLERDREELYERIDARVRRMFESGVMEEVNRAEAGATAEQAIGYAEIKRLLGGEMSAEECVEAIQQRTRQYAKRQLTWLRRENIFFTINLTQTPNSEVADFIARRILAEEPDGGIAGGAIDS
jgi:tRNA dimethylallyltransferase